MEPGPDGDPIISSGENMDGAGNIAPDRQGLTFLDVFPVVLFTFLVGAYFVLRYNGLWAENDTAVLTSAIRSIIQSGQLLPQAGNIGGMVYANGYAYQAIGAMLAEVAGLDPAALQQIVLPLAIALLAIPACLLFYEITGSRRSAVIGSLLLFTQSEFLFVVLRGSHEKFGRLFMILALLFLFRSFKAQDKLGAFAAYSILFYLALYGQLASNFLLGFSFVAALALALLAGVLLEGLHPRSSAWIGTISKRLLLVVPASFILAFTLMFFLYPPLQQSLLAISTMLGKASALLLGSGAEQNVYQQSVGSWITPGVYILVNLSNFMILLVSLPIWAWQGWAWIIRRRAPKSRQAWLLWLLYGAFGLQALVSALVDASGGIFNNIQFRLFPTFAFLGIAILCDTLGGRIVRLARSRLSRAALGLVIFALAALSMVKATNEASLGNYWTFYTASEINAVRWMDQRVENSYAWLGFNNRLAYAFQLSQDGSAGKNYFSSFSYSGYPYIFISDWVRQQGARLLEPLPYLSGYFSIYDNGKAQIYHLRPVTPYQH